MIDQGRFNVLGIRVSAVDYEAAVERIVEAAHQRRALGVSALAVHGVMTGVQDPVHGSRLNHLDLIVPDGQPIRWALRWLHGVHLPDRVYGPMLTLKVCERAAVEHLPIYLYGSRPEVLTALEANLRHRFPGLEIAGSQASLFRNATPEEQGDILTRIRASGAALVFVGLGCPRQEVWAYENRLALSMPVLAVGAAFDFHAGLLPQAPPHFQRLGLEWLFRLVQEPRRLWRRYLVFNSLYVGLLGLQALGLKEFTPEDHTPPPGGEIRYA
jgi:N-acetylglucosaminyldiphosphoundecaprenol N-acetyl-beta-D-mannosaminyltransferase